MPFSNLKFWNQLIYIFYFSGFSLSMHINHIYIYIYILLFLIINNKWSLSDISYMLGSVLFLPLSPVFSSSIVYTCLHEIDTVIFIGLIIAVETFFLLPLYNVVY
jgi:hypothetical protein